MSRVSIFHEKKEIAMSGTKNERQPLIRSRDERQTPYDTPGPGDIGNKIHRSRLARRSRLAEIRDRLDMAWPARSAFSRNGACQI